MGDMAPWYDALREPGGLGSRRRGGENSSCVWGTQDAARDWKEKKGAWVGGRDYHIGLVRDDTLNLELDCRTPPAHERETIVNQLSKKPTME